MKKKVLLFGILFLVSFSFVLADIPFFEVDETSSVFVQGGLNVENNEMHITVIGKIGATNIDGVNFDINGENTNRVPKSDDNFYYKTNNVSWTVTDIYNPIIMGTKRHAQIRVGKEFDLSRNDSKKIIIFDGVEYEIELGPHFSDTAANFKINGPTIGVSLKTGETWKTSPDIYTTVTGIEESHITIEGISDNEETRSVTIIVSKEINISEGEQVNFQFIDKPGISLEDAEVNILCNKTEDFYRRNSIDTYFKLKNNRNEVFDSVMYFKSDGLECYYGDCHDFRSNDLKNSAFLDINGENFNEGYVIEIDGKNFLAFNYTFDPNEEIEIEIYYMDIRFPFNYYLDSLSSYQSAKHEKITIEGYCDAIFNENYPVNLISNENNYKKWIWEYSDINTFDENLQDILIVTESALPDCTPDWECGNWNNWTCDLDYEYMPSDGLFLPTEAAGNETRSCQDGCGHSKIEYEDCPLIEPDNTCDTTGLRENKKYCSSELIWISQKPTNSLCEEDFECKTNNCEIRCQGRSPLPIPTEIYWIIGVLVTVLVIGIIVSLIIAKKK